MRNQFLFLLSAVPTIGRLDQLFPRSPSFYSEGSIVNFPPSGFPTNGDRQFGIVRAAVRTKRRLHDHFRHQLSPLDHATKWRAKVQREYGTWIYRNEAAGWRLCGITVSEAACERA